MNYVEIQIFFDGGPPDPASTGGKGGWNGRGRKVERGNGGNGQGTGWGGRRRGGAGTGAERGTIVRRVHITS